MARNVNWPLASTYALCKYAGMTLDEYLRTSDDTAQALADRCSTTEATISRIRGGGQNSTIDLLLAIVRETQGKVTLAELGKARQKDAA